MSDPEPPVILLPVFDDWPSLERLLQLLDQELARADRTARVLIVDDGSVLPFPESVQEQTYERLVTVERLRLLRNLGHQRAIAVGLAHLSEHVAPPAVVVMDSDGEDDPADVPRLLAACEERGNEVVFAERLRRSEGLVFRACYAGYRLLHRILTGYKVRVGNFSAIPNERLRSLVVVAELWNHYAAGVFRSRQPYSSIPAARAPRIAGQSKMNFVGLVVHGLSAISVYGDIVGVRLLLTSCGLLATVLTTLAVGLAVGFASGQTLPPWTGAAGAFALQITAMMVMLCIIASFVSLSSRNPATHLPLRDYAFFVDSVTQVYPRP